MFTTAICDRSLRAERRKVSPPCQYAQVYCALVLFCFFPFPSPPASEGLALTEVHSAPTGYIALTIPTGTDTDHTITGRISAARKRISSRPRSRAAPTMSTGAMNAVITAAGTPAAAGTAGTAAEGTEKRRGRAAGRAPLSPRRPDEPGAVVARAAPQFMGVGPLLSNSRQNL